MLSLVYVLFFAALGVLAALSCVPRSARPAPAGWMPELAGGLVAGLVWDWIVQAFRVPIAAGGFSIAVTIVLAMLAEEYVKWAVAALLVARPGAPRGACAALSALLVMAVGFGAGRSLLSALDGRWDPFPVRAGYEVLSGVVLSGAWMAALVRYRSRHASAVVLWGVFTAGWAHACADLADRHGAWALPIHVGVLAAMAWSMLLGLERTCWDDEDDGESSPGA
jgi:hypothetical protein